jgi:hypothetical protein
MPMLGAAGVTVMLVSVFAVTVSDPVPLTPLREAVMVVVPAATQVAMPVALMVAAAVLELVHVAEELMLAVEPSPYVAVAVNCCVPPATMLAVAGVTAMLDSVFATAVTVSVAVPLTPLSDAVMVVAPAATPVARPAALMVAAAVLELDHVTEDVMLALEPSL